MKKIFQRFEELGVLGMNRRNAEYTLVRNIRKRYPLVDDKLKTKEVLFENRIPSPDLFFTIDHNFELRYLNELKHLKEFVIKPARGAEGRGIYVFEGKIGHKWKRSNGELLSTEDIQYHISNILAGLYSLGGLKDRAFIEYRVKSHSIFRHVAYQGVPDIRMILYRGVPVMSMLRLPTKESGGRANLHQGAVGVGVNMISGITYGRVHHNRMIDIHPDTDAPIGGLVIPFWEDLLKIAASTYQVFNLGYLGVDFVIDQVLGPLILELNARPGLNIQLANRKGLRGVLESIDSLGVDVERLTTEKRLEMVRQLAAIQ